MSCILGVCTGIRKGKRLGSLASIAILIICVVNTLLETAIRATVFKQKQKRDKDRKFQRKGLKHADFTNWRRFTDELFSSLTVTLTRRRGSLQGGPENQTIFNSV